MYFCTFQVTVSYFAARRLPLSFGDKLEFVNFWYLLIIFNDFLTVAGCVVKILIENKVAAFYSRLSCNKCSPLLYCE